MSAKNEDRFALHFEFIGKVANSDDRSRHCLGGFRFKVQIEA